MRTYEQHSDEELESMLDTLDILEQRIKRQRGDIETEQHVRMMTEYEAWIQSQHPE